MNIEDLTLKQIREIQQLAFPQQSKQEFLQNYIGKYAIIRTRNEGINSGKIEALDETGIVLSDARRIYYHRPKDRATAWYEGVAVSGLSDDSKVSVPVSEKVIVEDYSITLCTPEAEQSLRNHKSHVQS